MLAELQQVGVDVEADVGEVLRLTESWDVKAHLLGRERRPQKTACDKHFEPELQEYVHSSNQAVFLFYIIFKLCKSWPYLNVYMSLLDIALFCPTE